MKVGLQGKLVKMKVGLHGKLVYNESGVARQNIISVNESGVARQTCKMKVRVYRIQEIRTRILKNPVGINL
jgi:hypothetical protein